MSDQKNISPLLDGFTLGAAISQHHGVVCYPAIKENSNKNYIVKEISVPASQAQFDALILAGAYKDPAEVMDYFRKKGESLLKEAEFLKKLSKIEGFLPFDGWQMEPITRRRLGYRVYLVGSYKRSLDKYIRKNAFTHLEAVNLGLDLCSALSVCRQAGYLYADLKPSNVYVSENKEYRIGDLGFLSLDSLRYTSLPESFFSPYSPPELQDPMISVNLTVDTYAVGMILYQLYNDGQLPFRGDVPAESLANPCHADYEMAEIIMKAIDPDPKKRWTDPKELGKAIAAYIQRNNVTDIPITPFIPLDVKPEDLISVSSQKDSVKESEQVCQELPEDAEAPTETEEISSEIEEATSDETEETLQCVHPEQEAFSPVAEEATEDAVSESIEKRFTEETEAAEDAPEISEQIAEAAQEENAPSEAFPENEASTPEESDVEGVPVDDISEELARILSRADEMIAHEIPEETGFPEAETEPDPFAFAADEPEISEADILDESPDEAETEIVKPGKKKRKKHFENPTKKNRLKKFFGGCLKLILLAGLLAGGFWYYQNIYLQPIDAVTIEGTQNQITVLVDTTIEESRLTVHCTDGSGKQYSQPVQGGKATFDGLKPDTSYTLRLDMNGFHKLTGETSAVFTTEAATRILSFEAIAGNEDGSVKLDFTYEGNEPDFWNIRYQAEGEEERLETITGNSALITDLTVGKRYTFTLDGGKNFGLSGETSLQFLAARLILAENITVTSSDGSDITVNWKAPGDTVVESWNVRFFDDFGSEEQITVTETSATFTDVDPAFSYTVEITAAGMTRPARLDLSADPILISDFQVDESGQTEMKITWKYEGTEPEGGWELIYTVEGSTPQTLSCEKTSAKIAPLIPGAKYTFTLQTAKKRTVLNNTVIHSTQAAEPFTKNAFDANATTMALLRTPEEADWIFENISPDAYTTTFRVGESVSLGMQSTNAVYLPGYKTNILYVFRDSYGNVIPELVTETSLVWKSLWLSGDSKTAELSIPTLPGTPGNYKMELYFDGGFLAEFDITITE